MMDTFNNSSILLVVHHLRCKYVKINLKIINRGSRFVGGGGSVTDGTVTYHSHQLILHDFIISFAGSLRGRSTAVYTTSSKRAVYWNALYALNQQVSAVKDGIFTLDLCRHKSI